MDRKSDVDYCTILMMPLLNEYANVVGGRLA